MLPTVAQFLRSSLGIPDEDDPNLSGPRPYTPAATPSEDWDAAQRPSVPTDWSQPVQPPAPSVTSAPIRQSAPDMQVLAEDSVSTAPGQVAAYPGEPDYAAPAAARPLADTPPNPYGAPRSPAAATSPGELPTPYGQVTSTAGEPDYVRPREWYEPTSTERRAWNAGVEQMQSGRQADGTRIGESVLPEWAAAGVTRVVGGANALNTASDAVYSRVDPVFQAGLAVDGIVESEYDPQTRARIRELQAQTAMGAMPQEVQDELDRLTAPARARYEQIKDNPDAVTRYANISPSKAAVSVALSLLGIPLGSAAGSGATATARGLGAGTRTARAAGYAADVAAQGLTDPTNLVLQPGVDAAVRGVGATVRGARAVGRALEGAGDARLPQGQTSLGSGLVPEQGARRFYHGTASEFATPDPASSERIGIYGPGYYLSDSPELASDYAVNRAIQNAPDFETPTGANVRAVNVPSGVKLFDMDGRARSDAFRVISTLKAAGDTEGADIVREIARTDGRNLSGGGLFDAIREAGYSGAEVQGILRRIGYDGLTYNGQATTPLSTGQRIAHRETMIFPESLNKIRNAFSGEAGGSGFIPTRSDLRNAAQGGVLGAASEAVSDEELTPEERAARVVGGAALGVGAGRRAGRQAGRRLGSGMVAEAPEAAPNAPTFYSQLRRTIEQKMPNRAAAQQIQGILKGGAVKPDEIAWTGLDDWLREQRGPITKQQVLDFLDQNEVRVEEVVREGMEWVQEGNTFSAAGVPLRIVRDSEGVYHLAHETANGVRYSPTTFRTLNEAKAAASDIASSPQVGGKPAARYGDYTVPGGKNYRELLITRPNTDPNMPDYQGDHWEEPNVLAHVRFSERATPDGKRALHIEEIQSDWHQEGRRKGYSTGAMLNDGFVARQATRQDVQAWADEFGEMIQEGDWIVENTKDRSFLPGRAPARMTQQQALEEIWNESGGAADFAFRTIPPAPFQKSEQWASLAVKRMMRWAAENDFDRIVWTPGEVQKIRYSPHHRFSRIDVVELPDGGLGVSAWNSQGRQVMDDIPMTAERLRSFLGNDLSARMAQQPVENFARSLRGDQLVVENAGLGEFYDKLIRDTTQKLTKKFGARVGRSTVDADGAAQSVWSVDVTPQMKQSVLKEGQPMFAGLPFDPASAAAGGALGATGEGEDGEGEFDPLRAAAGMALAGMAGTPQGRRLALRAAKQAKQSAPPNLLELMQGFRFSWGMLGNFSTGAVNAMGAPVEIALGLPSEAFRLGVLRQRPAAVVYEVVELLGGLQQGARDMVGTIFGQVPQNIRNSPDFRPPLNERMQGAGGKGLGHFIEFPGRLTSQAPDAFWRPVLERWGRAREAANMMAESGTSRFRPDEQFKEMHRLLHSPTADEAARLETGAKAWADEMGYKGDPGYFENVILKTMRGGSKPTTADDAAARQVHDALGSFIMPFFSAVWKIHKLAASRVPGTGFLTNTSLPLDEKLSRQVVGAALGLYIADRAARGLVTGPGPSDPDEAALVNKDMPPNHFYVTGIGWVPNDWAGSAGPYLNAIGGYFDAQRYATDKERADPNKMGDRTAKDVLRAFQRFPVVEAAKNVITMVESPTQGVTDFLSRAASSFAPAPMKTYLAGQDPSMRTTDRDAGFLDQLGQKTVRQVGYVPGLGSRQDLPEAQDRFGRTVENPRQGWNAFGLNVKQPQNDPVIRLFREADVAPGPPKREFTPKAEGVTGLPPIPLNQKEQRDWLRARGQKLLELAGPKAGDPAFSALPFERRQANLQRLMEMANQYADGVMQRQIGGPEINRRIQQIRGQKRAS